MELTDDTPIDNPETYSYCVNETASIAGCTWTPFVTTTATETVDDGDYYIYIKDDENNVSSYKHVVMVDSSFLYTCTRTSYPVGPTIADCPNCVFTAYSYEFTDEKPLIQFCGETMEYEGLYNSENPAYSCLYDGTCTLYTRDYTKMTYNGNRLDTFIGIDITNSESPQSYYVCAVENMGEENESVICLQNEASNKTASLNDGILNESVRDANITKLNARFGQWTEENTSGACDYSSGDWDCYPSGSDIVYASAGYDWAHAAIAVSNSCEVNCRRATCDIY